MLTGRRFRQRSYWLRPLRANAGSSFRMEISSCEYYALTNPESFLDEIAAVAVSGCKIHSKSPQCHIMTVIVVISTEW